jgi:hypothetical protein
MRGWTAAALGAVLVAAVLVAWVPARWPASIIEVGAFGLALAWTVRLGVTGERARWSAVLIPVAGMMAWGLGQLQFHWTLVEAETARSVVGWGANFAVLFVGLQIFEDRKVRERFLAGLLWFAFGICLIAVPQSFTAKGAVFWMFPVPDPPAGMMGPFLYHTHFANFIELALPMALIPALGHPRKRLWYAFMAATMIASVILSASRGGFVIVTVETAVVFWLEARKRASGRLWAAIPAIGLTLATTAILASMVGWSTLIARLMEENPYADRLQLLRSSIPMFRDHLWTGAGLGAWPSVYPLYARFDLGVFVNQAHNDWAQVAAEGGVVGLALFAWMFGWSLRQAGRSVRCWGLVCVFVHAFFDYPFHKPQIAALVFAVMAAGALGGRGSHGTTPSNSFVRRGAAQEVY